MYNIVVLYICIIFNYYEKFKNLKGVFKKSILFFQDLYYYICIVIK